MILYFLARDVYAVGNYMQHKKMLPNISGFPILAAFCWGFALYMYQLRKEAIQGSLRKAMTFVFQNGDVNHWTDFVPFYVPPSVQAVLPFGPVAGQ